MDSNTGKPQGGPSNTGKSQESKPSNTGQTPKKPSNTGQTPKKPSNDSGSSNNGEPKRIRNFGHLMITVSLEFFLQKSWQYIMGDVGCCVKMLSSPLSRI
uniref:Uncharacterized protein n=1 Tax=Fagus sylvatica TaxID=28930 RepID=A0A2N9GWX3_FAGSY